MAPDVGMNEIGWGMSTPAWTGIVSRCDSAPPGGINSGWYCDKNVDAALDQALLARDAATAKELYQKANHTIMDDAAFVPTIDDLQPIVVSPKVHGFVNPPEDWYDLSIVSVD